LASGIALPHGHRRSDPCEHFKIVLGDIHAPSSDPVIAREACVTGERLDMANTIDDLPGERRKIMCGAVSTARLMSSGTPSA
jgi:hypothetical protein